MSRKSPDDVSPKRYRQVTFLLTPIHVLVMHASSLMLPVLVSLAIVATSCSSVDDCLKGITVQNTSVTLETGLCFGNCPVYSGTILGDGNIMYDGRRFTEREGVYVGSISRAKLCELVTLLRQTNLEDLRSETIENVPDAPISELRIVHLGKVRSFKWNMRTPEPLKPIVRFLTQNTHENQDLRAMGK